MNHKLNYYYVIPIFINRNKKYLHCNKNEDKKVLNYKIHMKKSESDIYKFKKNLIFTKK